MKKITKFLSGVLLVSLSALAGCSTTTNNNTTNENSEPVQEFAFVGTQDITTLDAGLANDEMSGLALYSTNAGLVRAYQGEIQADLAESWEISEDALTYTFTIKEDLTYSDGETAITAEDFEYAFKRILSPDTASTQAETLAEIEGAPAYSEGSGSSEDVAITAIDETTLEIKLTAENPFFLAMLAEGINFYPLEQAFVEEQGTSYGSSPETTLYSGPFTVAEWTPGSEIVFEKNDAYWNAENIQLEKVTEIFSADANTSVSLYDAGDVDALYTISSDLAANYETDSRTGGSLQSVIFQSGEGKVMNNENLRLALSNAIDRQSIIESVTGDGTEIVDRLMDPTILYEGESVAESYPVSTGISAAGDVDAAQEYLAIALEEMGLSSASDLPTIVYVCMESEVHQEYAQILKEQWEETLGVTVEISIQPVSNAISALISGDYDIYLLSMSTGVSPDTLISGFVTDGPNNYANWNSAEFTSLIETWKAAGDMETRLEALTQAEQLLLEEAVQAPLWMPGSLTVTQDYVKNLTYGRYTGSMEFIYAYIEETE